MAVLSRPAPETRPNVPAATPVGRIRGFPHSARIPQPGPYRGGNGRFDGITHAGVDRSRQRAIGGQTRQRRGKARFADSLAGQTKLAKRGHDTKIPSESGDQARLAALGRRPGSSLEPIRSGTGS